MAFRGLRQVLLRRFGRRAAGEVQEYHKKRDYRRRGPYTPVMEDIVEVQTILGERRLPRELVDRILLQANYCYDVVVAMGSISTSICGGMRRVSMLSIKAEGPLENIARVSVTIRGFGISVHTDPNADVIYDGTYRGSKTWYTMSTSAREVPDMTTPRLATNLRSMPRMQVRTFSWDRSSPVVQQVMQTKTVALWAHSSSDNWINVAKESVITFSFYPFTNTPMPEMMIMSLGG